VAFPSEGADRQRRQGVTIADAPTLSIVASQPTANEATGKAGTFTITRSADVSAALVVTCTIGGTATNEVDYDKLWNSFTIPAGQASYTLWVVPTADGIAEGSETVIMTLSNGASATVNIIDGP